MYFFEAKYFSDNFSSRENLQIIKNQDFKSLPKPHSAAHKNDPPD